ncbi:GEVED domain-containing protein [Dokdonia ponticola]|uniref:GEVED domain-containing protein n=1 Tax=Dokdonia ponticola TaxID=2041041 RepID=A0ABV9I059_9FLAO
MKLVVVVLMAFGFNATAQETLQPTRMGTMADPILVPSIADQIKNGTVKYADNTPKLGHAKGKASSTVIPGKGFPKGVDPLLDQQRNVEQRPMRSPDLVFVADISQATPSDPTGAAGVNQYMAAWNSAFRIFDKDGNPESAELALGTIFPGNNIGDPIIFFDAEIDNGAGNPKGRFVITEFDNNPNGFNVAVSTGPDAMTSSWHVYTTGFGTGSFPDYTKFSVWGDSYIVTANINASERVFAVERNEMIQGNPAQFVGFPLPGIATNGFYSPQGFHITDDQHPPAGTPAPIIYLQDDAWGGVPAGFDHLQIWEATIDWANPANHSIATAQEIGPAEGLEPFVSVFDGGSFSNRPQPGGPDLDVLQATVMNQVQYRRFGTHNSVVLNFVVNALGTTGELAGIRWYELRQPTGDDTEDWVIHQQGTYTAPDGRDAYSASMVMNTEGDIAMAYSSSSATDQISIRYTGRQSDDALNIMTSVEQLIAQSTAANPSNRFADYVQLTIDPVDDSFWHIAEYFEPSRRDVVANFTLLEPMPDDIGVSSIDSPTGGVLSSAEPITISIRNFGNNDITDPMVQYSIDGTDAPAEMFSGTIAAGTTESFTFATLADLGVDGQTYEIVATTLLAGDSNTDNDSSTVMVTNSVELCEPVSDCAGFDDGVTQLQLADQDIAVNCGPTGYSDDRDIVFTFDPDGPDTLDGVLQMGFADSIFAIWIDVNDNGIFEAGEVVATEQVATANSDFAFSLDLSAFTVAELAGEHTMRVRGEDESTAGDVLDPCGDLAFGRTNDYTAFFDESLSTAEEVFEGSDLVVSTTDNNQFEISLITPFNGRTAFSVFNLAGQRLAYNNLTKEGNQFNYSLDMSYAAAGVYIVQFDAIDGGSPITAKIIVK